MLTLNEVLADAAASPGFEGVSAVAVNSRGVGGETPLQWMATLGDAEGIALLLAAGADINAQDASGNTALHLAVSSRQAQTVKFLRQHGADLSLKNAKGQTAKELAVADGFLPSIELLGD